MVDFTAPILTALSFPSKIVLTSSDITMNFEITAYDSQSGVKTVYVWFNRDLLVGAHGYFDSWSDGRTIESETISKWIAPGTYTIKEVELYDNTGNIRSYTEQELIGLGFRTNFEIFSDGYQPTPGSDNLYGSGTGDHLCGYAGDDTINGLAGNDTLDGGSNSDLLIGGAGDDTYFINVTTDTVIETANGGDHDSIYTSINLTLTSNVEHLYGSAKRSMILSGNALQNSIIGTSFNDTLTGGAGRDTLQGGDGNDTLNGDQQDYLYGGKGNDIYITQSPFFLSENKNEGIDEVRTSVKYYWNLNENIERLVYSGSEDFTGYGNQLSNYIKGGSKKDFLSGELGNDTIAGGYGNDTLKGGAGADSFLFNSSLNKVSNFDSIDDFSSKYDSILLDDAIFKSIGSGTADTPKLLRSDYFAVSAVAKDKNDFVLYDKAKGMIYYDSDGSGSATATLFATVKANTVVTSSDFLII